MSKIRILGIDPSLRNTGLVIGDYHVLTGELDIVHVTIAQTQPGSDGKVVRKSSDDLKSARILIAGIRDVIATHKPTIAVSEVPTGAQSSRASFSNGVCCAVLASVTVPLIEVSPTEVKMASVGDKKASKEQMIQWAVGKWPAAGWRTRKQKGEIHLLNDNEHIADACAAIVAGTMTAQFAQAVAMMQAMAVKP